MTKGKALVEEVFKPSKHQSSPVLLKFQNGDLVTSHKDNTLYLPMKHSDNKEKHALVVAGGNVYTGTVGKDLSTELTDTYICVRNKTTNKVRILPMDQVKLINNVYQEIKATKFNTVAKENSLALVMRTFGGKRDQRFLNKQERNEVSVDIVKEQLEMTVEQSEVLESTEPVVSAEDNVERIRPQFNKDATSLENVFNLYDVIPLELIDRLDEEANALLTTDVEEIPISSDFLKNAITSLKNTPQSGQTLLKLKIIIYMDALQMLVKSKKKVVNKLELSKITEKVENDIRERFAQLLMKNKVRTSFTNEKAICYYLVLGFMISENYSLDLNILSQELCIPKSRILKFAHLVNATQQRSTNSVTLRLPSKIKPLSFSFIGKRKT